MTTSIAVAGATGNLGRLVVAALRNRGAEVRALVRPGTAADRLGPLEKQGAKIAIVDLDNRDETARALSGVASVVSALQGLHGVIVDTQSALLDAAASAGVPRFIPSDFAIDFTRMPGTNRNFDLRLEFHRRLDAARIQATSIFQGGFMDMLLWGMPLLDLKGHRVTHWGGADQPMQFTTMNDTAAFTAAAALDEKAPRYLRVAGDMISPRQLAATAESVIGERFEVVSAGTVEQLKAEIERQRAADPNQDKSVFPVWVQLQYSLSMVNGLAVHEPLDNGRYPGNPLTTVKNLLTQARTQPAR
ncbi:MAG: NmrA family NAD(P)-binding protein [Terriglobales bacterium]